MNRLMDGIIGKQKEFNIGDWIFTVHSLHDVVNRKPVSVTWHRHSYFEVSLMSVGSMQYELDSQQVDLCQDRLLLIPPGIMHRRYSAGTDAVITGFHLGISSPEGENRLISHIRDNGYTVRLSAEELKMSGHWRTLLLEQSRFYPDWIRLTVQQFLLSVMSRQFSSQTSTTMTDDPGNEHNADLIGRIKQFISDNRQSSFDLNEIAAFCGYSPRHLNRLFLSREGISIGRYMIQEKLYVTQQELIHTDKLIKTIAYENGYRDVSYFCRLFKRYAGVSPGEYRERFL